MFDSFLDVIPLFLLSAFCITGLFFVTGRKYSTLKTGLIIIPIVSVCFLINVLFWHNLNVPGGIDWFLLTMLILETIIVFFLGQKKGLNYITAAVHVFLSFYIIYMFKNVISMRVGVEWPQYVIYAVFFPLLLYYLKYYYAKLQNELEALLPKIIILLFVYGVFIFTEIIIYSLLISTTTMHVLRLEIFGVAIISIYVISVAGFYLIIKQYRKRIIELNNENMINKQLQAVQDQYKLREIKDNQLRILRHDMKHILINVTTLIKNGKYIDALDFTSQYVEAIDSTSEKKYCNDPIINSILDYYKNICDEKKISLNIKVNNFEDALSVSPNEMGVFISNCLDNAINAVLKLESELRIIDFIFLNNDDRLVLQIKNNYDGNIILDENNRPTSMDSNHGIGTNSIGWFADRNDLIIDYEITDKTFAIIVLFKEKIGA